MVRTDGRAYGHVITKFSRMGRLPHFLSYGAPSTRALRARVELRYNSSYVETIGTNEFYYLDTTNSPNRNKYLTRQVQHERNNATLVGRQEFLLKMKTPLSMRGLIRERNNWEIRVLLIVKFLLIDIHFLRLLGIRCYQIPDLN